MEQAADRLPPLLGDFRLALGELTELYRTSGEYCATYHPAVIQKTPEAFLAMMQDLHRGLLVKIFVEIAQADWRWSPDELRLAEELFAHVWDQRLQGPGLMKAVAHVNERTQKLDWGSLVRPFAELAPLRDRAGELETLIVRIANLVAKADGTVASGEVRHLEEVQRQLRRHLPGTAPRAAAPGPGDAAAESVDQMHGDAPVIRRACDLEPPKIPPVRADALKDQLDNAMAELQCLIGLEPVKYEIRTLVNVLKLRTQRRRFDLPVTPLSLHTVFAGNPGTGKTTVARILGRILGAMGILSKGQVIETDRSGLVAEYAGQTGPKANKKIDEALDGVLFIDEAYSLVAKRVDDPYGAEAVSALLKRMEDDRERLVAILAGYPKLMDSLLKSNPGLSSRLSRKFIFPDYTAVELGRIFQRMAEKNHYVLPPATRVKLMLGFQFKHERRDEHFGNGRLARNVFESAVRRLANRIAHQAPLTRELLTTLVHDDIEFRDVPGSLFEQVTDTSGKFTVGCDQCGQRATIVQTTLGRRVQCRGCQATFVADWGEPRPLGKRPTDD